MQTNNSKEKLRQLQNKLYLTAKKCDSRNMQRTTVQGNVPVPQQKSYEENESRNQEECKQSKPASCKGRRFNKESESENHRMEELLFYQNKWEMDAGIGLVHYLYFHKMVQQETPKPKSYVESGIC